MAVNREMDMMRIGTDTATGHILPNGNNHGHHEEWNKTNVLLYRGEWSDGEKVGVHKEWNVHGSLVYRGEYIGGKKVGVHKEWCDWSGQLISWIEYRDGKIDGLREECNHQGPLYKGQYRNGKKVGVHEEWHEDGNDTDWNGEWFYVERLSSRGEWRDGARHGIHEEWNEEGILSVQGEWRDGEKVGTRPPIKRGVTPFSRRDR